MLIRVNFLAALNEMFFSLSAVAKKRSLFDDRPQEIQELTYIIREDITNLNKQIGQLKNFVSSQQNQKHNTKAHSTNVVVTLQSKLASMSSEFKQVLEVRTEVISRT